MAATQARNPRAGAIQHKRFSTPLTMASEIARQ